MGRFRIVSTRRVAGVTRRLARMVGACLLGAAVLAPSTAAAALVPAAASDQFVFAGRGYGHGVGMSQWGAWQAAREGKDFRFILGFYYTGVSIDGLDPADPTLKVKLSSEPWKDVSSITQEFAGIDLAPAAASLTLVYPAEAGEQQVEIPVGGTVQLTRVADGVRIVGAGSPDATAAWVEARPADGGRVRSTLHVGGSAIAAREYWGDPAGGTGDHHRRAGRLQPGAARALPAQHRRGRLRLGAAQLRRIRARGRQGAGGRRPHLRHREHGPVPQRQPVGPGVPRVHVRAALPGYRPGRRGYGGIWSCATRARSSPASSRRPRAGTPHPGVAIPRRPTCR